MPEFYTILARKIIKMPEFYDICPKNLQNFRILHDFCPKNARILRNNCPKNIFARILGRHVPPLPPRFLRLFASSLAFSSLSLKLITSAEGGDVFTSVCLSACLSVRWIT